MGFRINTNIGAMNAHMYSSKNNVNLDKSLSALSSGLRINKAADDASGMAIADSLRAQANGLGQAIKNANDGIGVAQTADGALDEYINIINTIRTKSIQAASDGQNTDSRQAIQRDITKLLEEAQNIATTTSFNGQKLLDGTFTNKSFQIGAYANETVGISIDNAQTSSIGSFAEKAGTTMTGAALTTGITINGQAIATTTDNAKGLAAAINGANTGVTATASTEIVGSGAVTGGAFAGTADSALVINGVNIGAVTFTANDETGTLRTAINAVESQTGVHATLENGSLVLTDADGDDITLSDGDDTDGIAAITASLGFATIKVNGDTAAVTPPAAAITSVSGAVDLESEAAFTIAYTTAGDATVSGIAAGTYSPTKSLSSVDVTTAADAQEAIKISDYALGDIDRIRSEIGSVQNQLESTIRNISVTQVNVTAAESQIRDVDFAAESANFSKFNILAQSGSYAMSQANAVQQNVLRLLQ